MHKHTDLPSFVPVTTLTLTLTLTGTNTLENLQPATPAKVPSCRHLFQETQLEGSKTDLAQAVKTLFTTGSNTTHSINFLVAGITKILTYSGLKIYVGLNVNHCFLEPQNVS